jgi:GTP-binding protein
VGRSNVGKSSLLNALLGRRVARVSGTPGKTRSLNVYRLPHFYLVDLPGYGFAQASRSERAGFQQLLETVLERRPLRGVVWLLDIRREPSADDLRFRELLARRHTPLLTVLTKADKLGHERRGIRTREIAETLELDPEEVLPTSSVTQLGMAQLGEELLATAADQTR